MFIEALARLSPPISMFKPNSGRKEVHCGSIMNIRHLLINWDAYCTSVLHTYIGKKPDQSSKPFEKQIIISMLALSNFRSRLSLLSKASCCTLSMPMVRLTRLLIRKTIIHYIRVICIKTLIIFLHCHCFDKNLFSTLHEALVASCLVVIRLIRIVNFLVPGVYSLSQANIIGGIGRSIAWIFVRRMSDQ